MFYLTKLTFYLIKLVSLKNKKDHLILLFSTKSSIKLTEIINTNINFIIINLLLIKLNHPMMILIHLSWCKLYLSILFYILFTNGCTYTLYMFSFFVNWVIDSFWLLINFSYFYFTSKVFAWLWLLRCIISIYILASFYISSSWIFPLYCNPLTSLSLFFSTFSFFNFNFVILDSFMFFSYPLIMSLTLFFSSKSSYLIFVTLN